MYSFLIVDEPTAPLDIFLLAFDDTYVSFKWQQPISSGGQPLSGFKIYREDCTLAATTYTLLATLPASQFQYTDSTVTGGIDYKFYVTAFNQLGPEGPYSAGLPNTPIQEPLAAAAPTLVQDNIGKDFIVVEWIPPTHDGSSPITRYILWVRAQYDTTYQ